MFWDNFKRVCMERNTNPSRVCLDAGFGKNRASNWKINGTIPKEDELHTLATILDCEVADFFVEDFADMSFNQTGEPSSLSPGESRLLTYYRVCTTEQKRQMLDLVSQWVWDHLSKEVIERNLV